MLGIGGQDACHVKGDVAVADDHDAFVTQIDWRSVKSGWPLIQATISVAVPLPGRSMPSTSSRRSFGAPTA